MRAGTSEPEYAESIGDSLDMAIRQAVDILGAREDEVDVEVLEEGRRGFLWFSPKRPFRVRVTWRADQTHEEMVGGTDAEAVDEPAQRPSKVEETETRGRGRRRRSERREPRHERPETERSAEREHPEPRERSEPRDHPEHRDRSEHRGAEPRETETEQIGSSPVEAERFVAGVFSRMDLDAELSARDDNDGVRLRVSGEPAEAFLAERDGEVQSALQVLTHRVLSRRAERSVPVVIEIGESGPAHESDLRAMALRLAEEVAATSEAMETAPLSSPDRRIIHRTLADHPTVATESQGRGLLKRVRISPR